MHSLPVSKQQVLHEHGGRSQYERVRFRHNGMPVSHCMPGKHSASVDAVPCIATRWHARPPHARTLHYINRKAMPREFTAGADLHFRVSSADSERGAAASLAGGQEHERCIMLSAGDGLV